MNKLILSLTLVRVIVVGTGAQGVDLQSIEAWKKSGDIEKLVNALEDESGALVASAALALAELNDPRAIEPLIHVLGDGRFSVREAVATSLERLGEPLGRLIFDSLEGSLLARQELAQKQDSRAFDVLLGALSSADIELGSAAALTLGEIGDPRAIGPLRQKLNDENAGVRRAVVTALGKAGDPGTGPDLIAMLGDQDSMVRQGAAQALETLGIPLGKFITEILGGSSSAINELKSNRAPVVLSLLLELLGHDDEKVRSAATRALKEVADSTTLEPLLGLLRSDEPKTIRAAAQVLGAMKAQQAVLPLAELVTSTDPHVREAATEALAEIGDREAVGPLIARLTDPRSQVRLAAAIGLGVLGDRQAVASLIRTLGDEEAEVRTASAASLEELGEPIGRLVLQALNGSQEATDELEKTSDPRLLDPLAQLLGQSSAELRVAAARTLGALGDRRAIGPLSRLLEDHVAEVRRAAVLALRNTGDPRLIDRLMSLLTNADFTVRALGAEGFGQLGDPVAVQPLIATLADPEPFVRKTVVLALGSTDDPAAVDGLIQALSDSSAEVRDAAATSLERLGEPLGRLVLESLEEGSSEAREELSRCKDLRALAPVVRGLEDERWRTRENAVWTILHLVGPDQLHEHNLEALLIQAIGDRNRWVRRASAQALSAYRIQATQGSVEIELLIEASDDPEPTVRRAVVLALGRAGDPRATEPLIAALDDADPDTGRAAARALGKLGDRRAVEALLGALAGDNDEVVDNAARALENLGEPLGRVIRRSLKGSPEDRRELAQTGDPRALSPLLKALAHKESGVRRAAALTLGEIRHEGAVTDLVRLASGWHPLDRLYALVALLRIRQGGELSDLSIALRILKTPASLVYLLTLLLSLLFLLYKLKSDRFTALFRSTARSD